MAVNISNGQLGHATLVDDVVVTLRETGLQADRLVLEVTESLAIDDPAGAKSVLMELRTLGVRVSIDDFGTGHSSLASLGQLPLDALKLDRSFVRGIDVRPDLCEIVAAVLVMARQLGLRVIAEGIENEAQLAAVRSLGCDYGQGYLFARPLASEHVTLAMQDGLAISSEGRSEHLAAPGADSGTSIAPDRRRGVQSAGRFMTAAAAVLLVALVGIGAVVVGRTADVSGPPGSIGVRVPASSSTTEAAVPNPLAPNATAGRSRQPEVLSAANSRDRPGHEDRCQADLDARSASASDGQLSRAVGGVASRGHVPAGRPRTTGRRCVHVPFRRVPARVRGTTS